MHWPWSHRPTPGPLAVHEVLLESGGEELVMQAPQYWDRNTLLIDLQAAQGAGSLRIKPIAGRGWPIRLEFRVQPGRIGQLTVSGAQRVVFLVPAQGDPVVLQLQPGVYVPSTPAIELHWSRG